ncbi:MAG: cytochrome c biogenesis protein ResB, partial [Vicinamibacteria bacterium]
TGFVRGVVKAPSAEPELGLDMWFYNDLELTEELQPFNASPEARNPAIFFREYRGDLGLDKPQSVYRLEKAGLAEGELGAVSLGERAPLADGTTVEFTELRQFTVFQVARDPGAFVVLLGAIMVLAGLIPSLYVSRRRLWIRVVPAGEGARIEAAGVALQRRAALPGELEAIVREVRGDRKMVPGPTAGVGSPRP